MARNFAAHVIMWKQQKADIWAKFIVEQICVISEEFTRRYFILNDFKIFSIFVWDKNILVRVADRDT